MMMDKKRERDTEVEEEDAQKDSEDWWETDTEVEDVDAEKNSEEWCFVCKYGGELVICDHKDCLKVYHLECVGEDKAILNSGKRWTCSRHSCSMCRRDPSFYCLCCPKSLCKVCMSVSEFALLRKEKYLCKRCLKLIVLAEENTAYGLEIKSTDLEDPDTFTRFKQCWESLRNQECFTLADVYRAESELKRGKNHSRRYGNDENEDLTTSDSNAGVIKSMGRRRRLEYLGWGSKPLIEFLRSTGNDTTKKLSRVTVVFIILRYIRESNLYLPQKTKKVQCDDSLYSIFKMKEICSNKIYSLLEEHFVENVIEDSGRKDKDEINLENQNKGASLECKKRRIGIDIKTFDEKKVTPSINKSNFAAIVPDNMKLVYIRKTLLEEFLREPDHLESKLMGSFVRVKNLDYLQRNTHQLSQVTGMKKSSETSGLLLQVSNPTRDVPISLLSDTDFTEEECEDLRQNVAKGLLNRLTVVELEQKARRLHEEITKHWIQKELVRLQRRIDFANERGWKREKYECLDKIEELKKPSEQVRLLKKLPEVIPELRELDSGLRGY